MRGFRVAAGVFPLTPTPLPRVQGRGASITASKIGRGTQDACLALTFAAARHTVSGRGTDAALPASPLAERSRPMAASSTTGVPLCDIQAQFRELRPQFEAALARVLESGQVILGPEVAALEEEVAALLRRRPRRRLRLRHRRPVAGPARPGNRPRRRGHPAHLHLLRHGRRRLPHRRPPGLRRHRPGHLQPRPVPGREQDHAAHAGRAARPPVRPVRRHGAAVERGRATRPAGRRGRRPVARLGVPGQARRQPRRPGAV